MSKIAIISATFGGMDKIKKLPEHPGISSILYTGIDEFKATSSKALRSWSYVAASKPKASGMLEAKYIKMNMLDMQPKFDYYVWADGSVVFDDVRFIEECCDGAEATFIRHPSRKTVHEEYEFCCTEIDNGSEYLSKRYSITKMCWQMQHLTSYGNGYQYGDLWCGGLFIVKNTPQVKNAMGMWWDCVQRFGVQDQLPLGFAFAQSGVRIRDMGINITNNSFFHLERHLK